MQIYEKDTRLYFWNLQSRNNLYTQTYRTRVRKKNFIIVINFYQNNWSAIDFEIECILLLLEKGKRVKIDGAKFEKKKIKNK